MALTRFPDRAPIGLSVNVSPAELITTDFVDTVHRILTDTGLDGRHLTLEITEKALVRDTEQALATLRGLHRFRRIALAALVRRRLARHRRQHRMGARKPFAAGRWCDQRQRFRLSLRSDTGGRRRCARILRVRRTRPPT